MHFEMNIPRGNNPNLNNIPDILQTLAIKQEIIATCNDELDQLNYATNDLREMNESLRDKRIRAAFYVTATGIRFDGEDRIGVISANDGSLLNVTGTIDYINFGLIASHRGFVIHMGDLDLQSLGYFNPTTPSPHTAYVPISHIKERKYISMDIM